METNDCLEREWVSDNREAKRRECEDELPPLESLDLGLIAFVKEGWYIEREVGILDEKRKS